jgi:Alginate lyase
MRRRYFCLGACSIMTVLRPLAVEGRGGVEARGRGHGDRLDVRRIDHDRVLRAASRALTQVPITLTSTVSTRSPGGPHDYYSEGDYWWPDPANPSGPYIRRDGHSNPANFVAHRDALIHLSLAVPALVAAWRLTGDARFADHAVLHLRAWFIAETTRMNPHLNFAQAITGLNKGRGIGIIDTLQLVEVARAAHILRAAGASFTSTDQSAVTQWFRDYLHWLTTSANGVSEREEKNNHGSCWLLQCLEFASLTGDEAVIAMVRERFKTVILPQQISPDGRQSLELARTKPYSYSLFNLDVLSTIGHVLSQHGENLWQFETADGRGLRRAVAFMAPYIEDKRRWPYAPDVEYFDQLPVRQVQLLFAGLALSEPGYLDLWRRLDPDPIAGEIIRNFPIRQPILWIS